MADPVFETREELDSWTSREMRRAVGTFLSFFANRRWERIMRVNEAHRESRGWPISPL